MITVIDMLKTAAEVGFSETAFLWPSAGGWAVRYFSPRIEVPFCGHATIAAGVAPEEADIAQRIRELTPQQFRVLGMLGTGLLNKQIAHALGVSEATVKAHMTAILRKLGANNRTQAILMAGRLAVDPNPNEPGSFADA